jgi:hypothetical protein
MSLDKNTLNIKELLLTPEEYIEHPYATGENRKRSYVFEISNKEKHIFYFGTSHTNDHADPLIPEIKNSLKEFQPDIVYVEGMSNLKNKKEEVLKKIKNKTEKECISDGEPIYALKLAIENNWDFESPEPDSKTEIEAMLSMGNSTEAIFKYYSYRVVYQYQRNNKNKNTTGAKTYLLPYLQRLQEVGIFKEEEFAKLKNDLFENLDLESDIYKNSSDPMPWAGLEKNEINKVARDSNIFRDQYIIERIILGLKKYDRLFVIFGYSHAITQEKALREILGNY